jgi:hypothetical protein
MDAELAEAVEQEYYRFEAYLRHAVHNIVMQENQQYVFDVDKGQRCALSSLNMCIAHFNPG